MKIKLGCEGMYIPFSQREATVLLAGAVTTVSSLLVCCILGEEE